MWWCQLKLIIAIPFTKVPTGESPISVQLAKLEKSNVGRLTTLNSSVDDNKLKTFISATETVMVKEIRTENKCKYAELREHSAFQTLTRHRQPRRDLRVQHCL